MVWGTIAPDGWVLTRCVQNGHRTFLVSFMTERSTERTRICIVQRRLVGRTREYRTSYHRTVQHVGNGKTIPHLQTVLKFCCSALQLNTLHKQTRKDIVHLCIGNTKTLERC